MKRRHKRSVSKCEFAPLGPDSVAIDPKRVQLGETVAMTLAVTGYPREVRSGWLDPLVNYPGAVDVSIFIEPTPALVASDRLRRQLARLESTKRADVQHGRLVDPVTETAAADAHRLAERLARGEVKLFQIGIYLCVRAGSTDELEREVARLRALLGSLLVDVRPTTFRALVGWKATLPFGVDEINMRRTFDTDALQASFPFIGSDIADVRGVFYGIDSRGVGVVCWDRFAQPNFNSVILARSGAGKSYMAKLEILRSLYRGTEVYVVDPENEYEKLTRAVGGTYFRLGGANTRINPFDLRDEPEALTRRCLFIHTFVNLLIGEELGPEASAVLDGAVLATYERSGITTDPRTQRRQAPTLVDLVTTLVSDSSPVARDLATKLRPFSAGSYRNLFDGPTSSALESHLVTFSLRDLPDEQKAVGTLLVLDHIWRKVTDPTRSVHRLVTVDEAWLLMRDPIGAKFLFRLAKSARKYGCGLTVITQDAADLLGSELGQAIVANSSTQILLGQAPQGIDLLTKAFRLTDGERAFLLAADRGEAIMSSGTKRVAFKAVASDEEHALVTSDFVAVDDNN